MNIDNNGTPFITPNSKGKKRKPGAKSLSGVLKCNDLYFLDFIDRCLHWDPDKRISPSQALQHPWITEVCHKLIPSHILSLLKLFQQHHFPVGGIIPAGFKAGGGDAAEVDTRWQRISQSVSTVPHFFVRSRCQLFIDQTDHLPTPLVVDCQGHVADLRQIKG